MSCLGSGAIAVLFILMGGYPALYPEKIIRHNQRWGWQPRWVRERATFTPNVLGARIAGAVGCIVGVGFLSKALAA